MGGGMSSPSRSGHSGASMLSGFFGPTDAPMFVATRTKERDPADITFDAIKKASNDLKDVSSGADGGMWQIKLLFAKPAYPNPPAWKTCVLVVRVPPGVIASPEVVPLVTLGRAKCGDAGCTQYTAESDPASSLATRTLWYDTTTAFESCLLFGRTKSTAMCATCPGIAQVQRDGLDVAIMFTERGDARQLVIVRNDVAFYDSLTESVSKRLTEPRVMTERPGASVLATGKVMFQVSPYVSDVALLAHHAEISNARPEIESFLEGAARATNGTGRQRIAVQAVAALARNVLSTEFAWTTKAGAVCPCRQTR